MWGPENARGRKGPHANRCGERLASGVSRRARRLFGQFSLRAAVFAHPTDATGTMVGFEGEITSIEASFDSPPENPRVKLNTRTPSRGGGSWQASIAVCLGCPWDQTSKLRFGLSIENLTNLASGPFSMLVIWSPRGPRVPMAWGGCASAAGYPIGCQIGSLARHETPLRWRDVRKPPKFRDQIVPAEISGPLRLELPAAKTSSYRYGKFWVDVRARHHGCRRIMPMFL